MLDFSMVWYLNKRANFHSFRLCARSLRSLALLTPRHSWMTHSRMNQSSQTQPELFLACPLRSFGVCLHSPRMLKHQCCCGSWEWHGQGKLEGRLEERAVRRDKKMVQWIGGGSCKTSSEQNCEATSFHFSSSSLTVPKNQHSLIISKTYSLHGQSKYYINSITV